MEIQFIFYNDINDQSTWIIKDEIQSKEITIKPRSGIALYAKQNTDSYDYTIQKYVIPQYSENTNNTESNTWKVCYCTPKRKQDYSLIEYTQLEVQYNTINKSNRENDEIAVCPCENNFEILINAEQDVKYNENDGNIEWYEVIFKGFQKVKNENKENEYDYNVYDNLPFNLAWSYWKDSIIQIDTYNFIPVFNEITHYDPNTREYEKSPQIIAVNPNANIHYVFNTMIEFCKNTKYNPSIIEKDNEGNIIKIGNKENNDIDNDENPIEITKYEFKFKIRNYTELKDIIPNSQKSWCVFNAGIYIHKGVTFESQIPVYINLQGGPIKIKGTITAPELIINSEKEKYTQCEMNKPPDIYW